MNRAASCRSLSSSSIEMPSRREGEFSIDSGEKIHRFSLSAVRVVLVAGGLGAIDGVFDDDDAVVVGAAVPGRLVPVLGLVAATLGLLEVDDGAEEGGGWRPGTLMLLVELLSNIIFLFFIFFWYAFLSDKLVYGCLCVFSILDYYFG